MSPARTSHQFAIVELYLVAKSDRKFAIPGSDTDRRRNRHLDRSYQASRM